MKKSLWIRMLSLALALVLTLSMVPQRAQALDLSAFDAFKRQATGQISGTWSDTKFWRANRYTYPFEFNSTLNSCTGFTLYYEIVSVEKGNLNGNFVFEVYVRTSSGTWKSVETFYLDGDDATVNVRFDNPMSIDAVAVVCQKKGNFTYTQDLRVYNATYKSTGSKNNTTNNNSSSNKTYSTGSKVSGQWADSVFRRSNRTTYPFEFYSPINRCKSFTLNYEITEVTKGSLSGNFKYCVYVRTTSGNWKYVHEFTMNGYSTSTKVNLDSPMSIDAVAVFCLKNSNMSYSYTFSITNPVTK